MNNVRFALTQLLAYCRESNWAGYEPYDALDSPILQALPLLNSRHVRIAMTQALKRSPINLRGPLLIPKKQNPKPLAVFLSSFVKLAQNGDREREPDIDLMIERLTALRSPGVPYWCWGYSFPWQTRTQIVPVYAPNLVCTSFVANALLDAYEWRGDEGCLEMAASAAEYILDELFWSDGETVAGFAYPLASVRNQVHNANFLAAALLCRVYGLTGEKKFLDPALRAARYSASRQQLAGSWLYGEAPTQGWIDNFHTGYNLCALRAIGRYGGTTEFETCVRRGFNFYRGHFFQPSGAIKYFHDRTYPVDTHCVAQTLVTLAALQDLDPGNIALAHSVLRWTMEHMWDKRGYFYYQVHRFWTIRIPYMRWTQAWMFLALATLLCDSPTQPDDRSEKRDRVLAEA
jgi:hypothetical protein